MQLRFYQASSRWSVAFLRVIPVKDSRILSSYVRWPSNNRNTIVSNSMHSSFPNRVFCKHRKNFCRIIFFLWNFFLRIYRISRLFNKVCIIEHNRKREFRINKNDDWRKYPSSFIINREEWFVMKKTAT